MLEKGSSEKWPKILEEFAGTKDVDVQPLIDYFEPLDDFLTKELEGVPIGWTYDGSKI